MNLKFIISYSVTILCISMCLSSLTMNKQSFDSPNSSHQFRQNTRTQKVSLIGTKKTTLMTIVFRLSIVSLEGNSNLHRLFVQLINRWLVEFRVSLLGHLFATLFTRNWIFESILVCSGFCVRSCIGRNNVSQWVAGVNLMTFYQYIQFSVRNGTFNAGSYLFTQLLTYINT